MMPPTAEMRETMAQFNANTKTPGKTHPATSARATSVPRHRHTLSWMWLLLTCPFMAMSQWQFDVLNNDLIERSSELIFPIEYKHFDCRFRFQAINNGITDNIQIINGGGCNANNHQLVIDGYQYTLPQSFEMNLYSDQWLITGAVPLGNCSTVSGNPINTAAPQLQLNGTQIQISDGNHPEIYVKDQVTYFVFVSTNGDIVCNLGTPFTQPLNLIFKWGFQ
ncbi:hypothetical protein [Marinicella meishanensis]|uniref:hypothetical protein n=1 Tax=Marinicella meishanensis TaxID=2873263 RepID=UPI001CBD67E6|nr:hypothetical protein [Marinicella sp. NBU2979]